MTKLTVRFVTNTIRVIIRIPTDIWRHGSCYFIAQVELTGTAGPASSSDNKCLSLALHSLRLLIMSQHLQRRQSVHIHSICLNPIMLSADPFLYHSGLCGFASPRFLQEWDNGRTACSCQSTERCYVKTWIFLCHQSRLFEISGAIFHIQYLLISLLESMNFYYILSFFSY